MNLFETILIHIVSITFPLVLYLFYLAYQKGIGKEENKLLLDFAFISSFYLSTRFYMMGSSEINYLFLHVPLWMAYCYRQPFSIFVISILLCFYGGNLFQVQPYYFILEYALYGLLYYVGIKRSVHRRWIEQSFIFISGATLLLIYFFVSAPTETVWINVLFAIGYITLLELATQFILYLFEKGEQILKFHMTIKELEREKQIRTSLFKITHEIKNPIAVCKGYLDMLDTKNQEHVDTYIPIMKEEIDRTLVLLQDFLSMTKVKVEKDILDINLLLEEVTNHFLPILKEKKIQADFHIMDDEVYINGDYHRLSQVIVNLLKNSVEAMEDGGTLSVSSKVTKDHRVEIQVKDQGCGISEENLKRMTEPFFTTKRKGTGLGVSLSNEIILAHEGTMKYQSIEGKGTTVTILLHQM